MVHSDSCDLIADRDGQATALLRHLQQLSKTSADIHCDIERLNEQLFGIVSEHRGLREVQAALRPSSSLFPEMSFLVDSIASNLNGIHSVLQKIGDELPKALKDTR